MIEQFFLWWLQDHYIWSTLLSPGLTILWCIFKGDMAVRGILATLWFITLISLKIRQ